MSMVCELISISDETIDLVRNYPLLALKLVCEPEEFADIAESEQDSGADFRGKLFGRKTKELPDFTSGENEGLRCELDKSWHGIHYLLTGSEWEGDEPLNFLLMGGEKNKSCDIGYGPGRIFTSKQVRDIDQALQKISKEEFEKRFNPVKMMKNEIYPEIWDSSDPENDSLEYLSVYFVEMKKFINGLAGKKAGLLVIYN